MSKTNRGYIAVGKDKDRAVANYRSAMMGKNIVCLSSETDSYITPDDLHTMFNPATGELDLQTQDISQQSLNFVSENSEDFGDAFWVVCADGCGSHIVYENDGAVKFCPVCSSELSEPSAEDAETAEVDAAEDTDAAEDKADETTEDDTSVESDSKTSCSEGETSETTTTETPSETSETTETSSETDEDSAETAETDDTDEDEDAEDDSEDDTTDENSSEEETDDAEEGDETEASFSGVVVSSTSYEKARKLYANAVVGKAARAVVSESGNRAYITSTSETLSFDPVDGESLLNSVADFTLSEDETKSLSTSEAHYMVCSSDDGCGNHVVSSVEISNCPVCSNKLQEPVVASADEDTEEETEEQVEDVEQDEPTDSITMNLLDDATDDSQLSVAFARNFVNGKDAWLASLNGQPVGFATRDDVGGNADIFDKEAFGKALIAQSKDGSKAALKEFGFKPFVITASVQQKVSEEVAKQVEVTKQELVAESKAHQERFMAALSIAAVGINRGFFSGIENPLKSKFWDSMSTAGIQNPEVLIDNIFSTSSDVYHKVLLDKASEILSMSTDVQNELASTVLGTAYQKASTSSTAPVKQQVGTLGTPVKSVSQSAVSSDGIAAKIQSLKFAKR